MAHLTLTHDADGIYTLCFDNPTQSTNTLHETFRKELSDALNRIKALEHELTGVIITSAKPTFFVGGDLEEIFQLDPTQAHVIFRIVESLKDSLKIIKTLKKPVVAAINGSALGTGFEIALFCHRRIVVDDPTIKLGFPATQIGLIPGAGGIVHITRLLGFTLGLSFLLDDQLLTPREAYARGLVDELAANQPTLLSKAQAFIKNQTAKYLPFERAGMVFPLDSASIQALFPIISSRPALLEQQTHGRYPAKSAMLSVALQSLMVSLNAALTNESREFANVVTGPVAKNMMRTLWFAQNQLKAGQQRPPVHVKKISSVGIVGAGMMGAGIAHACALNDFPVVLVDQTGAKSEQGKHRVATALSESVAQKLLSEADKDAALLRITTSDSLADVRDCDLVIEAVVEDRTVKESMIANLSKLLGTGAVIASNTSTLPITSLAAKSKAPSSVIGLHFFSPVQKMALVEIIRGQSTSDEAVAQVFDFVLALKKTPIVVNDSRGFYTTRVFGAYVTEGVRMLAEGQNPNAIENLAMQFGMPLGPLAIADELSLTLFSLIRTAEQKDAKALGLAIEKNPAYDVINALIAQGRLGRINRRGFYDYQNGEKSLWPGLKNLYPPREELRKNDISDRLAYIQAIEAMRCFEEGVVTTVAEANVGSLLGFGFPKWTGGTIQFINHVGVQNFVSRAQELADSFGPRFFPSALLQRCAADGVFISDDNLVH